MNANQLQQLLGVIRVGGGGGHKTAKFSSAEGTEWRIWRRNFEQTIQINGWANERSQRWSLPPPSSPPTSPPMSRAGPSRTCSTCTKAAFYLLQRDNWPLHNSRLAAQMEGEQIAVWHARLRTIFERTFPGENIQGSRLLINKFVLKLADSNIRQ
jgi:hypothetical protein